MIIKPENAGLLTITGEKDEISSEIMNQLFCTLRLNLVGLYYEIKKIGQVCLKIYNFINKSKSINQLSSIKSKLL